MLSKAAFNALLKTLEEPPEHAIFIFATTEPHKVLPTILSRVQRFDFKRIAVDEIVRRLKKISEDENISIDNESLHVIAKKADGALRDALGLMDQAIAFCGDSITHNELLQALNVVGTDRLFQFMDCVKTHDADKGLELINTLLQEGYDIQEFLIGLTEHLRNLYIAHHSKQLYMVEASEDTKAKYKESAPSFSRDDLMRMLHIVSEAQIKIKDANQPRIQFEITLLKLIHMERSENLAKLLSDLEEVKKNSKNLASLSSPESKPDVQEKKNKDSATEPEKENLVASTEESSTIVEEELPSSEKEPEATKEVDDEFDIGTPALKTRFSQVNEASKEQVKTEIKVETTAQHSQEAKNLQIEDIKSAWPEFIDSLNGSVSSILKMQTERALPVKLKGTELSLECDNQLAKTMLDEQAKELAGKLQECIGVSLRFNVEVSQKIKQTKARNPYERFKEIQQKDPMVRSLVERFGAELEY